MSRSATLPLLALLAGCAAAAPSPPGAIPPRAPGAPATCEPPPFDAPRPATFARAKSSLSAALGPPVHAVRDILSVEGRPLSVRAKLAYGALSKDLEHEPARLFVGTCSGWTAMADATSDDQGWVDAPLPAPLAPGSYFLRVHVLGDASAADGALHVLRPGARLAVFDVDGTLTTSDAELARELSSQLAARRHVPEAYPGGAALTQAHARRGDHVVYLTGRPYWLTGLTREWLAAGGFARGTLVTTDTAAEAMPTPAGVGDFKTRRLRALREAGLVVAAAYGNASTDVLAYREAGVAADVTFIIGKHAGVGGTRAVIGSWQPRARIVAEEGER